MSGSAKQAARGDDGIHARIEQRFGELPNFFRLASESPGVIENLWGFAEFGYLDNPLPPLFKERLFVYLSRFCEVRYCIARHVGFLVGLGRPSGDSSCAPETVQQVVQLINRPLPRGNDLEPHVRALEECDAPLKEMPASGSPLEGAIFSCAAHAFLQTPQASRCLEVLRRVLGEALYQQLLVFLAFVRTAHFWTKLHPELQLEDDIQELLAVNESLAACALSDSDAADSEMTQELLNELAGLRLEQQLSDAMRASEKRFRSLVTATAQIVWTTTASGETVEDSPTWREFTGQTLNEWRGTGWLNAVHPDDRAGALAAWKAAVESRSLYQTNYRLRRHDGEYRWTVARGVPVLEEDGSVREWVGTNTDIAASKQAESLRTAQRHVLELIATAQPLEEALAAVCRMIEEQEAGLLCSILLADADGRHTGAAFGPSLPPAFVEALQGIDFSPPHVGSCCAALDCGEEVLVADIEHDVRWSPVWRDLNLSHGLRSCRSIPILNAGGKVQASVAVFRREPGDPGPSNRELLDIATHLAGIAIERSRDEHATRTRSEQLQHLADVATRVNAAIDVASIAGVANEEARRLIGAHQAVTSFTADHNWAQAITTVSMSDKYARWRDYDELPDGSGIYSLVCRTNRPMRFTQAELEAHPAFKRFGRYAPNHPPMEGWLAAPLVGRDGRNIGLIQLSAKYNGEFTPEDESILVQLAQMASVAIENARLVEDLQEGDRRKDEFLATLAHELRNPLAPIRNGLQVLKLSADDPDAATQARSMMERQLAQMVRLIDDLLDLSRISRGKIALQRQRVDVAIAIQQAVETSRPLIDEAGHEFSVSLPPNPVFVDIDVTRIAQVVANLLNNSAKYTERGGRIDLNVERQNGEVVISVRDNGVGIPPAMLPQLFEMFTQIDRSLERSQGGLGIGLSIVKRLVEMHGGTVEARSDGHEQGSEFLVRLPVVASRTVPVEENGGPAASVRGRRILVVDDNRDAATSLAMLLRLMGNQTKTAHDGLEALDVAESFRPDLIMLDIGMPRLNGYDTARRIRELSWGESVVLVALTGWGQEEDRRKSQDVGFNHHLVKPIEPASLEELLSELQPQVES